MGRRSKNLSNSPKLKEWTKPTLRVFSIPDMPYHNQTTGRPTIIDEQVAHAVEGLSVPTEAETGGSSNALFDDPLHADLAEALAAIVEILNEMEQKNVTHRFTPHCIERARTAVGRIAGNAP